MTTFLIDTDILIDFFKNKPYAIELMKKLKAEGELAISILTVSELCSGWDGHQTDFFLPRLYAVFQRKFLTETIAQRCGELRRIYVSRGKTLPTIDALIAATATTEGCTLVTRNTKDYPMPELRLYSVPSSN